MIDAAVGAGCQNLLIDGGEPTDQATPDDYQRVADVANLVGSLAREAGLVCSWHQHWGTLFERPEAFDALMELTDPELVRFCPDTAQLTMGDFDVLATFRKYGPRIGFVHFKDLDVNRPWQITAGHGGPSTWSDTGAYHVDSKWRFVELGRGRIDFPAAPDRVAGGRLRRLDSGRPRLQRVPDPGSIDDRPALPARWPGSGRPSWPRRWAG